MDMGFYFVKLHKFINIYDVFSSLTNIYFMRNFIGLLFFIFSTNFSVFCQDKLTKNHDFFIQLSGVILSSDSLQQLPYVSVLNKSTNRGMISDFYGFFSLVVHPNDTLYFKSSGFKLSSFIVPDTLKQNRYSIIHMLQHDVLELPVVNVYPWPSVEDFARAFISMKPYDDALRRAQEQLSGKSLAFIAASIENDASMTYSWQRNQNYSKLYSMGQIPANNLLNPYSWSKFLNDWKSGKLKRE
jgi:hypothetical protein